MAETSSVANPERSKEIRHANAEFWVRVLQQLGRERHELADSKKPLPKTFVEKARICSDQIRRDFRLPHEAGAIESPPAEQSNSAPAVAADPLAAIRILPISKSG